MSQLQELLRAAAGGAVIVCKVRPNEGVRMVYRPRDDRKRDVFPWILEGETQPWARYKTSEVGCE
ncbi:hypothetical protein ACFYWP_01640 [Actinacidiphila glaucinigra]|uniref:hypothetical protein n=1 Tax=Actinacidiphila glaucinigra TaxID=235986 RepID=UPI0036809017